MDGPAGFDAAFSSDANLPQAPNNQFAFDLTLYALYSQLADARLSRADLAAFDGHTGTALLKKFQPGAAVERSAFPFAEVIGGLRSLLDRLKAAGYVRDFVVDDSDADEILWEQCVDRLNL